MQLRTWQSSENYNVCEGEGKGLEIFWSKSEIIPQLMLSTIVKHSN